MEHGFYELAEKKELNDHERVALAAVVVASTTTHRTMSQIYDELLGTYNHLFAHCDPIDRRGGRHD